MEYKCRVLMAGAYSDGHVNIRLENVPGSNGNPYWFWANPVMQKEMLATALTAMSAGLPVSGEIDNANLTVGPGDIAGTLKSIYVNATG